MLVFPSGGKLLLLKYRVCGKEKTLALGPYPERSLAEARDKRDEAGKHVLNGGDLAEDRKRDKREQLIRFASSCVVVRNGYGGEQREGGWT
jgi:hypothetical protein